MEKSVRHVTYVFNTKNKNKLRRNPAPPYSAFHVAFHMAKLRRDPFHKLTGLISHLD